MNNEFKKFISKNETRYVLETATSGGTSAGAVASNPGVVGELQLRLQELKAKIDVPTKKPRNPVGMGSTQGRGTQKHQDTQRKKSRDDKKLSVYENDAMDHEISMASSELTSIAKDAANLLNIVKQRSEEEGLEAWQQSKITKAADYMNSVLQSISGDEEQGVAEGNDVYDPLDPKNPANTTPGMTKKDIIKRRVGQDERGDTRVRAGQPRSTHLRNIPHLPEQGVAEGVDQETLDRHIQYYNELGQTPVFNMSKDQRYKHSRAGEDYAMFLRTHNVSEPGADVMSKWSMGFLSAFAQGWGAPSQEINRAMAAVRSQKDVTERYDERDEADMWYKVNYETGKLQEKSWSHSQSREAKANGWRESQQAALRDAGIIQSKYKSGKFVKNVNGKWVEVFPYGQSGVGEAVAESKERCPQCGMTNCTCAPGKCGCKPIAGWIPNKGFKKATDEQNVAEEKIKGVDGKACWKGKRYAGTKNGKDVCVPVGEDTYINHLMAALESKK